MNCAEQFIEYHKAIHEKRKPEEVTATQANLQNCIKEKVPTMRAIYANCGDWMKKYENCIKSGDASKCEEIQKSLRECSELQVKGKKPILNDLGKLQKLDQNN